MTACGCVTSGKVEAYKGTAAKETATWAASSKINVMAMAPTPTATATRFVIPDAFHPPHMWCSAATSYYLAASVRGWMEARPARGQRHMRVSWRRRLFWNVAAGPEGRICTSTDHRHCVCLSNLTYGYCYEICVHTCTACAGQVRVCKRRCVHWRMGQQLAKWAWQVRVPHRRSLRRRVER